MTYQQALALADEHLNEMSDAMVEAWLEHAGDFDDADIVDFIQSYNEAAFDGSDI